MVNERNQQTTPPHNNNNYSHTKLLDLRSAGKNTQKKLILVNSFASYVFRLRSTKRSTEPFAPWTIGVWCESMILVS